MRKSKGDGGDQLSPGAPMHEHALVETGKRNSTAVPRKFNEENQSPQLKVVQGGICKEMEV